MDGPINTVWKSVVGWGVEGYENGELQPLLINPAGSPSMLSGKPIADSDQEIREIMLKVYPDRKPEDFRFLPITFVMAVDALFEGQGLWMTLTVFHKIRECTGHMSDYRFLQGLHDAMGQVPTTVVQSMVYVLYVRTPSFSLN